MLDAAIKGTTQGLSRPPATPIEIVATLDASDKAQEMGELVKAIAELSDKISVRADGASRFAPSFAVGRPGEAARIEFAGIPMGHEFSPRWCWRCCRPAAIRPGRAGGDRADQGARGIPLRDLHLALLPQLPGCRAGR